MNTTNKANEWKAVKAGRRARIIGRRAVTPAPVCEPRQQTLAALAAHAGQRPPLGSLLAQAASTVRRWA